MTDERPAIRREPRDAFRALFKASRGKDALERSFAASHGSVAGVDEVGRGCLAGPVVAAAVILPPEASERRALRGITDSKLLDAPAREAWDRTIRAKAVAVSVGVVEAEEIDRVNILNASLKAMRIAFDGLVPSAAFALVDGVFRIPGIEAQQPVVRGDLRCRCIGAASIVAKVFRDRLMAELDAIYPGYGFASHKGYSCPSHRRALVSLGPSKIHRRSFEGVGPDEETG